MTPAAFRVWADLFSEPCALVTTEGNVHACNAACANIGLTPGSLLDGLTDADAARLREALRRAARSRSPMPWRLPTSQGLLSMRLALLERDGEQAWLLLRVTEETAARFLVLTRQVERLTAEISRRRESEAALAAERERLAVTLSSIGDGVIAVDTQARVVLLNPIAADLTGWSPDDARNRALNEVFRIFDERTGRPAEDPVNKVLRTGRIVGLANHTCLEARDGTRRSIADSAAPIRAAGGEILGVVLVFRDVTQQYRMEDALARAAKLESLGVLAGGIAHDFNNILTAVLGNLSLAQAWLQPDHPARARVSDALRAGSRAQNLTRQLLTFAGGGAPIKQASSLAEILADTARFALQGSPSVLRLDLPADLWPADVDAGQISQVVHNLVLNAHQAMPGGGSVTIRARNTTVGALPELPLLPGDYLCVDVEDTGPGLPSEHLQRVFDPFFTTKPTGTGLGLATVYSIVQRHGGHIEACNRPEGGARFSFWVPVAATLPTRADEATQAPPRGGAHVLVMDDDPALRELARACLEQLGCSSEFAEDGAAAVAAWTEASRAGHPFDLVLMDLTVPGGMGGLEAMQRIRDLDPSARGIVTSGYSSDSVMADFRRYGFVAVLPKPWHLEDLARVLSATLDDRTPT